MWLCHITVRLLWVQTPEYKCSVCQSSFTVLRTISQAHLLTILVSIQEVSMHARNLQEGCLIAQSAIQNEIWEHLSSFLGECCPISSLNCCIWLTDFQFHNFLVLHHVRCFSKTDNFTAKTRKRRHFCIKINLSCTSITFSSFVWVYEEIKKLINSFSS